MSIFETIADLSLDDKIDVDFLKRSTEFDNDEFFLILTEDSNSIFFGLSKNIKNKENYFLFDYNNFIHKKERFLIHNNNGSCECLKCKNKKMEDVFFVKDLDNSLSLIENMAHIIVELNLKNIDLSTGLFLTMNKDKFIEFIEFIKKTSEDNKDRFYLNSIYNKTTINKTINILNNGLKENNNHLNKIGLLFMNKSNSFYMDSVTSKNDIKSLLDSYLYNSHMLYSAEISDRLMFKISFEENDYLSENDCFNIIDRTNLFITHIYKNEIEMMGGFNSQSVLENPLHLNFSFNKNTRDLVDVAREVGFKDTEIISYIKDLTVLEGDSLNPEAIINFLEKLQDCQEKLSLKKSVNVLRFSNIFEINGNTHDLKNRYCNLLTEKEISDHKDYLITFNPKFFNYDKNDFHKEESVKLISINLTALNNINNILNDTSIMSVKNNILENKTFTCFNNNDNDLMFIVKNKNISSEELTDVILKSIEENSMDGNISQEFSSDLIDLYFREHFLKKKMDTKNQAKENKISKPKNKI